MATYLITGGAGFFGTILKKALIEEGNICVSIDLQKDEYDAKGFIPIRGDIRDQELLSKVFEDYKFDAIFHAAAMLAHDTKNKGDLWTSNVEGTKNIVEYAIKYKCNKLLFISSNCLWGKNFDYEVTEEELPDPVEIYGKSKLECEKILLENKDELTSIIFRSPTIIDEGRLGLLSLLFEFIDEGRKIPLVGDGNNRYQFIYAKDMVNAMKLALKYDKTDIFNIGSDNVKSFNEVYKYVIEETNSKSKLVHFPKRILTMCMRICFKLGISPLGPYQYKMISANFVFNTQKIKEKLGFKPTLSNGEMLLKSYIYYHNNRESIEKRKDVSAHNKNAKMGVIRLLKWMM
ncbi:MAG: NAD(P)-dependent oxidoreductase [Clostridia bacterium]|nr:NAD(P)-dependent oxidoreductase [Clostridia bacterium]